MSMSDNYLKSRSIQETFRRYEDAVDLGAKTDSFLNSETLRSSRLAFSLRKRDSGHSLQFSETITTRIVDVIIPVFGESPSLEKCIEAITSTKNCQVRITLVDNGTPENVIGQCERSNEIYQVIRNEQNVGFGQGCHQGIMATESEYLVLLNSDAIVEEDTIPALVYELEKDSRVAVCGATSLDERGSLSEFGRYFHRDAHSFSYGENENRSDPRFLSRLRVPYVSFICTAIAREEYIRVGGFDDEYFPAFYEDSDLCFRLKNPGSFVLVSPFARVNHIGGQSAQSLIDVENIRENNRHKFLEAHREELNTIPEEIDETSYPHEKEMLIHQEYSLRILVISEKLEDAVMDQIPEDTYDTFCSVLCFEADSHRANDLRRSGCEVSLDFGKKLHHWMRERIGLFDEVVFCDEWVATQLFEIVAYTQPSANILFHHTRTK